MTTAIALAVIVATLALWATSLRAREQALGATKRACRELGVELLDETVELSGLGVERDVAGRVRLRRRYNFEFTPDGHTRHLGWAVVLGARMDSLQFDLPEGLTIIEPGAGRDYGVRA
ncbi:DUF3301 domain-containing protein [Thiohalorhabdus sp.]|uniref:DUF3301 domain-containing protein n=1 Tax=Thiohalorhabdus sp. TaxID=3094134 RepID=UPI002FC3181E